MKWKVPPSHQESGSGIDLILRIYFKFISQTILAATIKIGMCGWGGVWMCICSEIYHHSTEISFSYSFSIYKLVWELAFGELNLSGLIYFFALASFDHSEFKLDVTPSKRLYYNCKLQVISQTLSIHLLSSICLSFICLFIGFLSP